MSEAHRIVGVDQAVDAGDRIRSPFDDALDEGFRGARISARLGTEGAIGIAPQFDMGVLAGAHAAERRESSRGALAQPLPGSGIARPIPNAEGVQHAQPKTRKALEDFIADADPRSRRLAQPLNAAVGHYER